jgi:hypothetical protein
LDTEKELLSYLEKYGNTRESDLIEFGTKVSGQNKIELEETLSKLVMKGWVKRIVHDRIDSNITYIAKGGWPLELALRIEADAMGVKDKEKLMADAKRILEEAEIAAEKRIRKKFPEVTKRPSTKSLKGKKKLR